MEIPKNALVGRNQSVYKLKAPVEAKKHNTCKIVIQGDVRARCISPKNKKGEVTLFSAGTIFCYIPTK